MATPDILDFEQLLAPISEELPSGVELKEDPVSSSAYYAVKDAREAARAAERQQARARLTADEDDEQRAPIETPDWRSVEDSARQVLAEKSKDLWIAAWLIEALARRHGFAGIRDGFRVVRELCNKYWDDIHPRPDEDGIITTMAQLTGLNGEEAEGSLIAPIADIPITESGTDDRPVLTGADYADAAGLDQMVDRERRAQRIDGGAITLDIFDRAARATSPEFFINLLEDIDATLDQFRQLTALLDEKCGKGPDGYSLAPPSSNIENALAQARERVASISRDIVPSDTVEDTAEEGDEAGSDSATPKSADQVRNREEAFRALLQVADFFRRTEPHSPVSYALEQAVRWGRMPLPDLLKDLISDESARREMAQRTGIPLADNESE